MMQLSPPTPFEVLIVDDDAGDVLIIEEALSTHGLGSTLHVVADGVGAMEFLRREGEHRNAPRPHLVLLDLNMPRKSGREVLEELKRDDDLASIPVVVLTTSSADEDILRSYDLHANAYVTKPVDFAEFEGVVVQIEQFYGQTAQLPGRRRDL
ncbi:response regulator [Cryptosporangium phraense]|uniref:Response regulator n=1 Tax=Cryptosporangium phraense TaxID=2593070 RepID=A0A545AMQ7_9ACTN|nr:response regulator [Cryptosporangium phraense]